MDNKRVLKNILYSLSAAVDDLNEKDIERIESGKFELSFLFSDKPAEGRKNKEKANLSEDLMNQVTRLLDQATTREEGVSVLEEYLKGRAELEAYARSIDVPVMKSDKILTVREKIADSTVGARLRSGAILGKKI